MTGLELELTGEVASSLDLEPTRRVFAALAASDLALPAGTVTLRLVSDEESRQLNQQYSGNDYATDVLSFSYIEDGEAIEGVIGELAISLPTAERQANEHEWSLANEVALLVLHGTLHIVGHDHQSDQEQQRLQALQHQIMAAAGYEARDFQWES